MSEKLISADVIKARLNNAMKVPANVWNDGYNAGLCRAETIINFAPAVDAVEVTYCDQCDIHGHCITEDTFRLVGVEKPFCCVGGRREENEID